MGLSESEFWRLSYAEYVWKWEGYNRRIEREQLTGAREIVNMLRNVNVAKKDQLTSQKFWPLSVDPVIKVMSEEDAKAIFDALPRHWRTTTKDN
jgi:hypothetical protein